MRAWPLLLFALVACENQTPTTPPVRPEAPATALRCTPWAADAGAPEKSAPPPVASAPPASKDVCAVNETNLASAEKAILVGAPGALTPARTWDRKSDPALLSRINRRIALTTRERALLRENAFVVLERQSYPSFAWAFHDVYQSELPVFVSVDAVLHAVYASNDALVADVEGNQLEPLLGATLSNLHCALSASASSYPPDLARDLDLYLTVARSLLADHPIPSVLGSDAHAAELVTDAKQAVGLATIDIFGRTRRVDWSAYQPRGHYTESLAPYFRASMWLSRMELNVVSRSSRSSASTETADPTETPHEAILAVALADLADRAGARPSLAKLDEAWALFAGRREDLSVEDLLALRKKAGITKLDERAFEPLKKAVGEDYQRTARVFPMPLGSTTLPVVATVLGPRIVADTTAFRALLDPETPNRFLVGAGDVAFVLGLEHGRAYLKDDLTQFPPLGHQLDEARQTVQSAPTGADLYGAWLAAIRAVSAPREGVLPSYAKTSAYEDLRLNSVIAGYGQIRHNYVLMAGASYDVGGCVIPDGWVDPAPAVYDAIAAYAERGRAAMATLDPSSIAYFTRLGELAKVLATISRHELAGRALTADERRFLGMVMEMSPAGTGMDPTYSGWYFDLFRGREKEALQSASFTADYHTSTQLGKVVYAGASSPELAVFVVDAGGAPRAMVGPVARGYEIVGPLTTRLTDETGAAYADKRAPWSTSYTAPRPPVPRYAVRAQQGEHGQWTLEMVAPVALPRVKLEALDHHGVPVDSLVVSMPAGTKTSRAWHPKGEAVGLRVIIGEYSQVTEDEGPHDSLWLFSDEETNHLLDAPL